ncbi:MAG TPA: homoserine O-succinyltransferase, partial [Steroidobacteraceae bacterium]|nr:homoserine O-succinyltransferase [Steroidobacteraceae bacterium]
MPVEIEAHGTAGPAAHAGARRHTFDGPIVIGLVNNMPDAALRSTEEQFRGLLQAAAGSRAVRVRLSSFPELPRSSEAVEHIARSYWPIDELLAAPLDALIVTGTEPRAARLSDEPYWQRSVDLLAFAEQHTAASVWSCLAAHSAVLHLDGIERRRLTEKRCGVYEHAIL